MISAARPSRRITIGRRGDALAPPCAPSSARQSARIAVSNASMSKPASMLWKRGRTTLAAMTLHSMSPALAPVGSALAPANAVIGCVPASGEAMTMRRRAVSTPASRAALYAPRATAPASAATMSPSGAPARRAVAALRCTPPCSAFKPLRTASIASSARAESNARAPALNAVLARKRAASSAMKPGASSLCGRTKIAAPFAPVGSAMRAAASNASSAACDGAPAMPMRAPAASKVCTRAIASSSSRRSRGQCSSAVEGVSSAPGESVARMSGGSNMIRPASSRCSS